MNKIVKRAGLLFLLVLSLTVVTACGGNNNNEGNNAEGGNGDGDKVTIRMANQVDENNFQNQGYEKYKEILEEKSDGQFEVEIYNGGTMVSNDEETVDAIKNGTLEMSTAAAYGVSNTTGVDALKLFDLPMIFEDRNDFYQLVDGDYGEMLKEQVSENSNIKVLGYVDMGFYGLLNSNKAVEKPEDLEGLKIRSSTADIHLDTLEAMGANPTPMAYTEIFTGLQQGTIDGVTTATTLFYGDRFYEVSNHLTLLNHVLLPHVLMINQEFYDNLSDELQAVLDESAEEYIAYARQKTIDAENEAIEGMEDEGVDVVELTTEQRDAFKKMVDPVVEKHIDDVGEDNYEHAMEQLGK